ncbi:MAG: LamG-like jellyroll fold domain-containing protein [Candidatus Paceibacterota bacterium]
MRKIKIKAFTLIELLVVIAIIGILSALIVVGMNSTTQKATIAKSQVFANSLKNSLMGNLVSEWKFDDGTGNSTTKDSWASPFANTGTLGTAAVGDASEPTWLSSGCVSGNCLYFDGSNDYIDFGNNASLSMGTGDATISLWVKFDNDTPSHGEIIVKNGIADTSYPGFQLRRLSGTSYLYGLFSDGTSRLEAPLSLSGSLGSNNWYNVVVVFDRDVNASIQAYLNGVKQSPVLNIITQQGNVQNSANVLIGAYDATTYQLAGKMDDVKLYNAAMPTSQIQQNYFADLNKLLTNKGVDPSEYEQRIVELILNYAEN